MPVEIKELVIRAIVPPASRSEGEVKESTCGTGASQPGEEQSSLVDAAVREVLRILKASKER